MVQSFFFKVSQIGLSIVKKSFKENIMSKKKPYAPRCLLDEMVSVSFCSNYFYVFFSKTKKVLEWYQTFFFILANSIQKRKEGGASKKTKNNVALLETQAVEKTLIERYAVEVPFFCRFYWIVFFFLIERNQWKLFEKGTLTPAPCNFLDLVFFKVVPHL